METLHFWPPPTESMSLNLSLKFVTGDYIYDFYSCAKFRVNPSNGGFWANRWNITDFFINIPFFKQLTYRLDHSSHFHAWWLKWRGLTEGCAFFGFGWYCSPFRGSNCPKTPIFGAWIGQILNTAKYMYWNVHIIKTTASIISKFRWMIETPK